jgi:hypothetical protein
VRILSLLISFSTVLFVLLTTLLTAVILAGPYFVYAQFSSTNDTDTSQNIGVKITSPKVNQTIPIGELTVYGTSSDTPETSCQVYVDLNDVKPMQNVTGIGPGGPNDFSNWTFAYTQNYHLITEGPNELTSKISCFGGSNVSNLTTKYNSINVTGSTDPTTTSIPAATRSQGIGNSTAGFHSIGPFSILPQYLVASTNKSLYHDDEYGSNSDIENGTEKEEAANDIKKDKDSSKSQTIEHLITLKVEKNTNGPNNNIQFKLHSGNFNSDSGFEAKDLNKHIRNLIKQKLDRVSERLLD